MPSYKEYQEQIAKLQALAEQARQEEIAEARLQIRNLMRDSGLSQEDLLEPEGKTASTVKRPVLAKYRDPASGKTWSGRGRQPEWINGKDREKLLIK